MELQAQLPADILALAAPAGRAPPDSSPASGEAGAAAPFDALMLTLAATAAPSGDVLPASGNALPPAPADLPSDDDVPAEGALDPVTASELLALIAPQPQPQPPQPQPPPAASPVIDSAGAAPSTVSTAGAAADWAADLQELPGVLAPAVPSTPVPPVADTAAPAAPGALPDLVPPAPHAAEQPAPADGRAAASADPAPASAPATAASSSERVLAAVAAAQSPPAAAAAAENAAPAVRPMAELRPSNERRTASAGASAATDLPRASAAPLPHGLDLAAPANAGDRTAPAPQQIAADAPPAVITPSAAPAASTDLAPLAAPHSPSVSSPHAGIAVDNSAQNAAPSSAQQGALDTTAARWHDALASRVQWLVDHDIGEARLKLNPPELGALDVKISLHDDKTFVQLTAHSAAARDELSQSLPRLRELLSANGLELGGATVSGGQHGHSGGYPGAAAAPRSFEATAAESSEAAARVSRVASSRIDVFA